jgi:chromosome segregation ATPase
MLDQNDVKTIKEIVSGVVQAELAPVHEKLKSLDNDVRSIIHDELEPLEGAVRAIVQEEIRPLDKKLDDKAEYLKQRMDENHFKQMTAIKQSTDMLNNDLIAVMKDVEKAQKRLSGCEVSIKALQPA